MLPEAAPAVAVNSVNSASTAQPVINAQTPGESRKPLVRPRFGRTVTRTAPRMNACAPRLKSPQHPAAARTAMALPSPRAGAKPADQCIRRHSHQPHARTQTIPMRHEVIIETISRTSPLSKTAGQSIRFATTARRLSVVELVVPQVDSVRSWSPYCAVTPVSYKARSMTA